MSGVTDHHDAVISLQVPVRIHDSELSLITVCRRGDDCDISGSGVPVASANAVVSDIELAVDRIDPVLAVWYVFVVLSLLSLLPLLPVVVDAYPLPCSPSASELSSFADCSWPASPTIRTLSPRRMSSPSSEAFARPNIPASSSACADMLVGRLRGSLPRNSDEPAHDPASVLRVGGLLDAPRSRSAQLAAPMVLCISREPIDSIVGMRRTYAFIMRTCSSAG